MSSLQFINNFNIFQQDYESNSQYLCNNGIQHNNYDNFTNNYDDNSQFSIVVYNENNSDKNYYDYSSSNSNFSTDSNIVQNEKKIKKTDLIEVKSKVIDSKTEPCRICGEDKSTGLHYGSIVCEACKKFFLRKINSTNENLKCDKNSNCVITTETRTNCAYCRLKKCLDLGMNINDKKEHQSFENIKCQVCSASSSGFHFGAITCEGCKNFFRRTVSEKSRLQCKENSNCEINPDSRNKCKPCRLNRCLAIGMDLNNSKVGRQSNLFKKNLFSNNNEPTAATNNEHTVVHNEFENLITADKRSIINNICESYLQSIEHSLSDENLSNLDSNECIKRVLENLEKNALSVFKFISNITFFKQLSNLEQRILVTNSVHSVRYMKISKTNNHLNYLYYDDNSNSIISKLFPVFNKSDFEFKYLHENFIKIFNLDTKEFSLYTLLVILSSTSRSAQISEQSLEMMNKFKHTIEDCLSSYMKAKRNETETFFSLHSLIQHYFKINSDIKYSLYSQIYQLNAQLIQINSNIQYFYLPISNNNSLYGNY